MIIESVKEDAKQVASLILRERRLKKFISTYYDRLLDNLYEDGCFRGYYLHCNTETARLTSDVQQVPKSDKGKIKKMFVSRYVD